MSGFRRRYAQAAIVLLNLVVLFVLLNVVAWGWSAYRRRRTALGERVARYGLEHVAKAYPELSREDLVAFLEESGRALRWEYEPFTEFRHLPMTGRFVNVSSGGYRLVKDQAPWPPPKGAVNVFVFGGSTTYGVGLPDTQTLPSHLQERLRAGGRAVNVYNLARAMYFSTQERILFEQLLAAGVVPAAALFVDGLNDTINLAGGSPPYLWHAARSEALRALVEEENRSSPGARLLGLARSLPLVRSVRRALERRPATLETAIQAGIEERRAGAPAVVERWLRNKALIQAAAARFGVTTLYVWQPIPGYHDDASARLFPERQGEVLSPSAAAYTMLERRLREAPDPAVLWLADLGQGRKENLYVDDVHYTSRFCDEIAGEIARALASRGVPLP